MPVESEGAEKPHNAKKTIAIVLGSLVVVALVVLIIVMALQGGKSGVDSITLDHESAEIAPQDTLTLKATVLDASGQELTDETLTWSSSNAAVATVKDGVVTGVTEGKAKITVKAGKRSADCTITVTNDAIEVKSLKLDKDRAEMQIGDSLTLTATMQPANAPDDLVSWASSDPNIATVKKGIVVATSSGSVTITASAGSCTATCQITVQAPSRVDSVTAETASATLDLGGTKTGTITFHIHGQNLDSLQSTVKVYAADGLGGGRFPADGLCLLRLGRCGAARHGEQGRAELLHGGVALGRIVGAGAHDDILQRLTAVERFGQRVAAQALLARDRKIRGLHRRRRQRHERDAPLVERPVEHHAHRIEVALGRDLRAAQHLRRHEIVCVVHGGKLRHAEVAELIRDLLVEVAAADKDVARLDIAVHDAAAMARLQRAAQTGAELDDVRLAVRMVAQVVRQGGQQLRAHIDVPAAAVRVRADDVILAPQQIRLIADGIDRHELPRDRLHLAVEQGGHFLRRAALGDEGVKVLRRGGDRQHLQRRVIHHAEAVVARDLVHRPVGVSAECTYRFPVLIVQIAESFFHVRSAPPSISG